MILYGASGHARVIVEILENSGIIIDRLFDDNNKISSLLGYECGLFDKSKIFDSQLIVSVGDNKTRKSIVERIGNVNFGIAVDKSAVVSKRTKIMEGSVLMPGVVINSGTKIGKHVIINTNSSVDHDCIIENYVHISPGSSISGNVYIKEGAHIGTGASVIPNISIGKWSIVGAGCVVINNIPDFAVVVGNPGKIIKTLNSNL
jgi:sugar O-acyltransferase (sialic acid O-acetyltransferase NeuD family)